MAVRMVCYLEMSVVDLKADLEVVMTVQMRASVSAA